MFEKHLFRKAKGQLIKGNEQKALEIFEKLMKKKKPTLEMKVFYAFYLMKNGDFIKARQVYDNLILPFKGKTKKCSRDTKVQIEQNYALLLWKEGNLKEAVKIPENIGVWKFRVFLYTAGRN